MQRGEMLAACLLCWSCSVCVVTAIQRADMFPYGTLSGDLILAEGDDETSRVLSLPKPLYFYASHFTQLYTSSECVSKEELGKGTAIREGAPEVLKEVSVVYEENHGVHYVVSKGPRGVSSSVQVATNGIISAQDLPMEKQYVDDGFPTDFPVVAPFLADIDTSGGRGQIYYRVTETPSVLNRVAQEVHRGFPDAKFTPTYAVVATWEHVAPYEEQSRTTGPSNKEWKNSSTKERYTSLDLGVVSSMDDLKGNGAEFTRRAEVIFYPGNQRLSITQTGRGLDDHNHLTVDTVVSGSVPFLPPGAEVTMDPFKETYQYYPSVATSTSVREYSVVSAERGSESFSFQLKQNITYRDCRHDNRATTLETLQITMERVFVMYVKEERILRYAITNKISPVGAEITRPELVNPCYAGTHDCDTTAQCIPQEGQAFQCQCATGYRGDGRNCYDVDECTESLISCGAHAQCVNLPGSHRCQCQSGYELGFDGRTCVDIDECSSSPCHISARCINGMGSFECQCQPGFYGDGFYCSQQGGLPSVAPPTVRPLPRPSVTPPTNTDITLLYAQGQKIGALPLKGTKLDASESKTLLTLHVRDVKRITTHHKHHRKRGKSNVYLVSPEGLAVDVKRRRMFWVDSNPDMIETANLDGSGRRTLFDTDLVNPRAIIVVSSTGTLYWTDWNREAPKIESSTVDGQNRKVVVSDGIGLPNALTYDSSSGQVCWADAGTKRLECVSPDGSGRRVIHSSLNYPFSMVYYKNHFYYTDWRRDGVIAVSKDSSQFTDEYLPDQRSHLYGIAIATSQCL
ncbi:Nidogen-2 [Collichthys lucidus]|uniref:Nidogen-2 n=1 Tax=Collichthys lucidus TaxID=240159 RepID=A0A4U5TZA6_COLLU|nr:Nidogen-2 [Collichthys lucidus]